MVHADKLKKCRKWAGEDPEQAQTDNTIGHSGNICANPSEVPLEVSVDRPQRQTRKVIQFTQSLVQFLV